MVLNCNRFIVFLLISGHRYIQVFGSISARARHGPPVGGIRRSHGKRPRATHSASNPCEFRSDYYHILVLFPRIPLISHTHPTEHPSSRPHPPHPHPDANPATHRHYLYASSAHQRRAFAHIQDNTHTQHNGRRRPNTLEHALRIRPDNMCLQRRITRTRTHEESRRDVPLHRASRLPQSPTISPPDSGHDDRGLATRRR